MLVTKNEIIRCDNLRASTARRDFVGSSTSGGEEVEITNAICKGTT